MHYVQELQKYQAETPHPYLKSYAGAVSGALGEDFMLVDDNTRPCRK